LFVQISPTAGGSEVGIAATTVKGYEVFEDRFGEIVAELRRTEPGVEPTGPAPSPAFAG
jgi:hypothetical protein